MAEKRRFLDVWIIESNTVYREVPFDVVADWIQQGRLLEDDKVRPSGTGEWFKIGAVPGFSVYLPRPEPTAEANPVEALEPVEVGFTWKRKPDEDESDVDMIPLIDVSLVLLIYFVMRLMSIDAGASGQGIPTPEAAHGNLYAATPDSVWVGVDQESPAGPGLVYSVGAGNGPADADDRDLRTLDGLIDRLEKRLSGKANVDLTINAHRDIPSGDIDQLLIAVEKSKARGAIGHIYTGVTGRQP
jgi:biopolymer transport protein ExbD